MTKKRKNAVHLQKNQLTMNNFTKKLLYLQCRYNITADIIRKQPCFVLSENLDNSQCTRMKAEVVRPVVYCCIHPISVGWVTLYTYWCELISFLSTQVVQNLQIKNDSVRTFFVPRKHNNNKDK